MPTYLSEIVAAHRASAALDTRSLSDLVEEAMASPASGGFRDALARADGLAVIAEIKRRSPSKGELAPDLAPAETAKAYAAGGARCLSVLTDIDYFGGTAADLRSAKAASGLPALRKDFTVGPADICDARIMGADASLLIVAALDPKELRELAVLAAKLGLDVLVEVHDDHELDVAIDLAAAVDPNVLMIGVNQRDLHTFEVDARRAEQLAQRIPPHVVAVAESGIRDRADAQRLAATGYQAVLVGETLVRASDPAATVSELVGHPVGPRKERLPQT